MPQIIFFALVGVAAYIGYRSFVKEAERVTAKVRRAEKQAGQRHDRHAGQGPQDRRIPPGEGLILTVLEVQQQVLPRVEFAPAKINLALHVTGRRADGYHLLESLAVFTRFGDRISIEARRRGFVFRRRTAMHPPCRPTRPI